jgi:DNA end-binding protein Ku
VGEFSFPKKEGIRQPELKMARQLIDSLAGEWQPEKYTDEYRDNLMRVIEANVKGKRPKLQERETKQPADVVDLMARLRASLEEKGRTAKSAKSGPRSRKTAKASGGAKKKGARKRAAA